MKYESLILTITLLLLAILFASSLKTYLPNLLKLPESPRLARDVEMKP